MSAQDAAAPGCRQALPREQRNRSEGNSRKCSPRTLIRKSVEAAPKYYDAVVAGVCGQWPGLLPAAVDAALWRLIQERSIHAVDGYFVAAGQTIGAGRTPHSGYDATCPCGYCCERRDALAREWRQAMQRLQDRHYAGELLKKMEERGERASKGRPQKCSSEEHLSNLGISKKQSAKWQQLADVPEAAAFDHAYAVAHLASWQRVSQVQVAA